MGPNPYEQKQDLKNSQYRLRQAIGFLGIILPIVIFIVNKGLLASISHYYYTSASIFFIGILFAFGLILISYKGYPKNKEGKDKANDDVITTIAGIAILITVLIPTKCSGSGSVLKFCNDKSYLFGHENAVWSAVHLISAAFFLFALGWMCIKQFTRNKTLKGKNKFYRTSGYIIWSCIGLLVVLFALEKILDIEVDNYLFGYTFYLEAIAVWAFGIAWLIKGKADLDFNKYVVKRLKTLMGR